MIAIVFVAWRGIRSPKQAAHVAFVTVPLGLLGLVIVSAPDFLEGMLL
ncbi:hypothetical protein [Amycolatopsis speibonae]|uniref:Uncharacterized protein n=1 Tax=Amycolatopsis speibonae TaxID=1450224 RepID=A0ABV7P2S1_9PSEU